VGQRLGGHGGEGVREHLTTRVSACRGMEHP
jgi:hypothetical protein